MERVRVVSSPLSEANLGEVAWPKAETEGAAGHGRYE